MLANNLPLKEIISHRQLPAKELLVGKNFSVYLKPRLVVSLPEKNIDASVRPIHLISVIVGTRVDNNDEEADLRQSGAPRVCS